LAKKADAAKKVDTAAGGGSAKKAAAEPKAGPASVKKAAPAAAAACTSKKAAATTPAAPAASAGSGGKAAATQQAAAVVPVCADQARVAKVAAVLQGYKRVPASDANLLVGQRVKVFKANKWDTGVITVGGFCHSLFGGGYLIVERGCASDANLRVGDHPPS
jgi:hypothetical protein